MNNGSVGRQGGFRVDNWDVVVDDDFDEVGAVLGDVAVLGDDDRDGIADEAHVGIGERPQRRAGCVEQDRRLHRADVRVQLRRGEHRNHTGDRARRAGVDTRDPAARDIAAHERAVEQAGDDDVVDVTPPAGEQPRVLAPADRLADEAPGGRGAHRPAARCTARTMP
jgi:hypothetical protein